MNEALNRGVTWCAFWKGLMATGCKQTKVTWMRAKVEAGKGAALVLEVGGEPTANGTWGVTEGWGYPKIMQ